MRLLTGIGTLLCIATWLTPTPAGGGWLWDLGNGIGLAALALVLALSFEPGRANRHRLLAWAAVLLTAVHGGYLLLLDDTLLEYLKPTMPAYMGAGLFALVLLVVVALTSSRGRRRKFYDRRGFRHVHWAFATLVVGLAGYHIAGSGFYLNHWAGTALFTAVLLGCVAWPGVARPDHGGARPAGTTSSGPWLGRNLLLLLVVVAALVVAPRNF